MIKRNEVKVFEERLYCDRCGKEMRLKSKGLTNLPGYFYGCECNPTDITTSETNYPRIVYEEK